MPRWTWAAALVLLALALPVRAAADTYTRCGPASDDGFGTTDKRSVRADQRLCWNVDENDSGDTLSELIEIQSSAGQVCVVPDKSAAGTATLTMDVLFCPLGPWGVCGSGDDAGNVCSLDADCDGAATCDLPCTSVLDADLDGTGGSSSNQNICTEPLGRGSYRCQIGVAAGAGEVGACVFKGF